MQHVLSRKVYRHLVKAYRLTKLYQLKGAGLLMQACRLTTMAWRLMKAWHLTGA